jgi:hypothetical protein
LTHSLVRVHPGTCAPGLGAWVARVEAACCTLRVVLPGCISCLHVCGGCISSSTMGSGVIMFTLKWSIGAGMSCEAMHHCSWHTLHTQLLVVCGWGGGRGCSVPYSDSGTPSTWQLRIAHLKPPSGQCLAVVCWVVCGQRAWHCRQCSGRVAKQGRPAHQQPGRLGYHAAGQGVPPARDVLTCWLAG